MPNETDFKAQLQWLKATTIRTGGIHDAQALQLKMYPLMLPNVTKAEAHVSVDEKAVHYIATAKPYKKTEKFTETCAAIVKWTRWLLWDDTKVTIKVNGKIRYESGKK